MPDTPKDLELAIWELLKHSERPNFKRVYSPEAETMLWKDMWVEELISKTSAYRCIVDAAREVLDEAKVSIDKCVTKYAYGDDTIAWSAASYTPRWVSKLYPTRTECIYRALKWLREQEGGA